MTINNLYALLDNMFPFSIAEEWDNSGFFNYQDNLEIRNIIVSLDLTFDVLDFAIKNNANFIITHHPLYIDSSNLKFSWMKNLISKIIFNKITILSLHTNYDKAKKGMNYQILKKLNLKNISRISSSYYLFIGELKEKIEYKKFLNYLKRKLNLDKLMISSNDDFFVNNKKIKRICVLAGAGSNELYNIKKKDKVDLFLTGEVKWHLWDHSKNKNISIIDMGHVAEKIFIEHIYEILLNNNLNSLKFTPFDLTIV